MSDNPDLLNIDKIQSALAEITDIQDIRKAIAMANAYIAVAKKTYKDTRGIAEAREDNQRALEIGIKAGEVRLHGEARLGEIIREMQERGELAKQGDNQYAPDIEVKSTLSDIGISYKESSRAQRVADNKDLIPVIVAQARENEDLPTRKALFDEIKKKEDTPHIARATGEDEWFTPKIIIDLVRSLMVEIDVDPASTRLANMDIRAKTYYTKEDDGLKQEWKGRVFMNPPYSQPLVSQFCELFVEKYISGEIMEGCVLVNNATETKFYQNMIQHCDAICFIKGRVKFVDSSGESKGAPLQGQTILYFGKRADLFGVIFSDIGVVLYAR